MNVPEALGPTDPETVPETLTADQGYCSLEEIGRLQKLSLKTVIVDPHRAQPRLDKRESPEPPKPGASPTLGEQQAWQEAPAQTIDDLPFLIECDQRADLEVARGYVDGLESSHHSRR